MYIHNLPALHFLSCVFRSFLGLSLRLFRWFLRLVYLPGLSSHSFLPLSFSPALLALLFLFFLLSFRRLFRRLFRFLREGAAKRPSVCVCVTPCTKGFNATVSTATAQQGRGTRPVTSNLAQRSWDVTGEAPEDALVCTCHNFCTSCPISVFDSMVVHDTSHKPSHFLAQLNCTEARHRTPVETLFNNTVFADSCTFPFPRLPSQRGN